MDYGPRNSKGVRPAGGVETLVSISGGRAASLSNQGLPRRRSRADGKAGTDNEEEKCDRAVKAVKKGVHGGYVWN